MHCLIRIESIAGRKFTKIRVSHPRYLALLFVIIAILFGSQDISLAGSKLDDKSAIEFIQAYIKQAYYPMLKLGNVRFRKYGDKEYSRQLSWAKKLSKGGLITFTTTDVRNQYIDFDAKTTDMINKIDHIICEKDKILCVSSGDRKAEKIVKIELESENVDGIKNQYKMVYFTYTFTPNDTAIKCFGLKDGIKKAKAVAKIYYDPFLEKYIFKGFKASPLNKNEWYDKTWVNSKGEVEKGFIK